MSSPPGSDTESALSDITLQWMTKHAVDHGLRIYKHHSVSISPNPNGTMHDSRIGVFSRLYAREPRSWDVKRHGKPRIHASVLDRTLNQHNSVNPPYAPWILGGEYDVEDD